MDAFAWLSLPLEKANTHRPDFKEWVDTYLLPNSRLGCTSSDLYSARCGLLHSNNAESELSRGGDASEIYYSTDVRGGVMINLMANTPQVPKIIGIHELLRALQSAIDAFEKQLVADSALSTRVESRLQHHFLQAHSLM
jgi:ribosomal protein S20